MSTRSPWRCAPSLRRWRGQRERTEMVWHIFKKDWKVLWPMVAGVALINVIQRVMLSSIGWFAFDRVSPLRNKSYIFVVISLFATTLMVVIAVLQDEIPGLRQDWLIR